MQSFLLLHIIQLRSDCHPYFVWQSVNLLSALFEAWFLAFEALLALLARLELLFALDALFALLALLAFDALFALDALFAFAAFDVLFFAIVHSLLI